MYSGGGGELIEQRIRTEPERFAAVLGERPRARSISLIRALLRQQGSRAPSGSAEACVQRVAAMTLPGRLCSTIAPVLAIMRHLNAQLAYSDAAIDQRAAHDARVQRLRTVPSIGPVTATAFVATLDDVQRVRHAHARWLLIQAVVSILRRRPPAAAALWSWALRIAARRGTQVAVVALARRLAGILYAPLRDGSVYEPRPAQFPGPVATVLEGVTGPSGERSRPRPSRARIEG
ncbi:MAG TPA: hypothetical protein VGV06_03660 [Methylomirabilota bacterium]|nr:hypothetical protein [Methylomirabilota bacterium]